MWSRRKFIETTLLSQLAMSGGALNFLYSCAADNDYSKVLEPSLQKILTAAMDEIIPAGDGMPSASEAGGMNYILKLMEQLPEQAKSLSSGLKRLNDKSKKQFSKDFAGISSGEKVILLEEEEKSNATFFNQLRGLTYECYYLSPKVWILIGYEPHPTLSSGPLMDGFDEKLLDRVRTMPSKYKDI